MNNKYFYTANFYLSAFLLSKGLELVNIDFSNNSKKADFVFIDTPEREALVISFNFAREGTSEVMIDARKLISAIRMLKDGLYQQGKL